MLYIIIALVFAILLDSAFEWLYLHTGWEWCLHGGVLGELQRQDRAEYLAKKA